MSWLNKETFDQDKKIAAVKKIYENTEVKTISENAITAYYDKAVESLKNISLDESKKTDLLLLAQSIMKREH